MQLIELIRIICEIALVCLIWPIQLYVYRQFLKLKGEARVHFHRLYVLIVTAVISPIIIAHFSILSYELYWQKNLLSFIRFIVGSTPVLATITLMAPLHLWMIVIGPSNNLFEKAYQWNWIRTLAWSLSLLISLTTL